MQVYRSALSACVMKDLPNVEYYMPLDRDRLIEGRKNVVRNNRPTIKNNSERSMDNESVNTVATQVVNNQNVEENDDDVIFVDVIRELPNDLA